MSEFDYRRLDDVIHSRIRLAAMSVLAAVESADFVWLRDRVGATDGNLGAHMKRLEDAGYVAADKRFVERKPVTTYRLTAEGRSAFRRYVDRLESMLEQGG